MMKLFFMLSILWILFIINYSVAFSQWQSDIRLTSDSTTSFLSSNNAKCITTSGNTLHVIWFDYRDGNTEIYYKRSTDGGSNWGADTRLTSNSASSVNPCIAASGQNVYIVWQDSRDSNFEIYFKRSSDNGQTWGQDLRLTSYSGDSQYPTLSVSGSNIHITWQDSRSGSTQQIYYKRSADFGNTWFNEYRITVANDSYTPSISISGNNIHIVWEESISGNEEIFYAHSIDNGSSWSSEIRLTNNSSASIRPFLSANGNTLHLIWIEDAGIERGLHYKRSTDAGFFWGQDIQLASGGIAGITPSVESSGQNVHLVWTHHALYYRRSVNAGLTWDTAITLVTDLASAPFVSVTGSAVHTVWADFRNNNYDIYYKRNPTGNPIGVKAGSTEIPKTFSLYQNYPNPFNPTTKIKLDIPARAVTQISNLWNTQLKIYNILGQQVTTLLNENLKPGTYEVDWDASNYPSGVYYYQLKVGNFSETKKLVLIK